MTGGTAACNRTHGDRHGEMEISHALIFLGLYCRSLVDPHPTCLSICRTRGMKQPLRQFSGHKTRLTTAGSFASVDLLADRTQTQGGLGSIAALDRSHTERLWFYYCLQIDCATSKHEYYYEY